MTTGYNTIESGKRIQALRKAKGLTQKEMSEQLNISLDHLKSIESGRCGCSIDLLLCLSDFFDQSIDYLVRGKEHHSHAQEKIQAVIDSLENIKMLV